MFFCLFFCVTCSISLTDYQSSDECKNPLSALEQNSQTMYDDDTISEKNMPENDDDDENENEDSTSLLDKHFANDAALSSPVVSEARNANCDPEEGLSLKICEMFTKFTDTLRHTQQPAATTSLISKVHEPFLKMLEQHIEKLPEQHQDQLKINILNYAFHYVKGVQNGDDVDEYALE